MPGELTHTPPRLLSQAVLSTGYPSLALTGSVLNTDWLGISANNFGFTEFPSIGFTAPQKLAEYDRARTSGIRMARTWFAPWWADASWPNGARDWNSADMTAFYTWLQNFKSRGIKVILTLGWHFPNDLCGISAPFAAACTPTVPQENNWAAWLSEAFHQIINVRSFDNVVAGFFFTEPSTSTGPIPGGYTAQEYYAHLVTIARAKIAADDASRTPILPRIKLIGCEEHSTTNDDWLEYMKANADAQFDAYAAHSYVTNPAFGPLGLAASSDPAFDAWVARFANWRGDASPKHFWADEFNFLAGGDTDSTGYRATADAGMHLVKGILGHMQAGAQTSIVWTLKDERIEPGAYSQQYGVAQSITTGLVRPSWYAFTMLANLCGGGNGSRTYLLGGETTTLHGVGVFIPHGDRWSTSTAGDWSIVVVNEGVAQDLAVSFGQDIGGRTVYRYAYSGEFAPGTAATLTPWDRSYAGVTTSIPPDHIPGRSLVIYSTLNISAPASPNLALAATWTSDSIGLGNPAYVGKGNPSNVAGATNGWRKADNASHWIQGTWASPVTIGRVELSFVATTAGVVWADYTTAATPAPVADYTLEYWTGLAWVQLVSVTGNALPNKAHTFPAVTTAAIRINVTSAAATAQVNNVGVY